MGGPRGRTDQGLDGATVTRVTDTGAGKYLVGTSKYLIGTSDGRIIPLEIKFDVTYNDGKREVVAQPSFGAPSLLDPGRKRPILDVASTASESGPVTVARVGPSDMVLQTVIETKALVGAARREESLTALPLSIEGEITALGLDRRAEDLFIGTSGGQLVRYDLRERASPKVAEAVTVSPGMAVTALTFLLGDRTLLVGDHAGGVSSWQVLWPQGRLTRIYQFQSHQGPVIAISGSGRDKGFVTADATGGLQVHYGTSGKTLLSMRDGGGRIQSVVFAPKSDAVLTADPRGAISQWKVNNPTPRFKLQTVFGRLVRATANRYVFNPPEARTTSRPIQPDAPDSRHAQGDLHALLIAIPVACWRQSPSSEFMHRT